MTDTAARDRLATLHERYLAARTSKEKDAIWRDILLLDKGVEPRPPHRKRAGVRIGEPAVNDVLAKVRAKARKWRELGMFTESEWSAVCAVLYVDVAEVTDADRAWALEAARSAAFARIGELEAVLNALVQAAGDYKWEVSTRDESGTCTKCLAPEGQSHIGTCVAYGLNRAHFAAVVALDALPLLGEHGEFLPDGRLDVERLARAIYGLHPPLTQWVRGDGETPVEWIAMSGKGRESAVDETRRVTDLYDRLALPTHDLADSPEMRARLLWHSMDSDHDQPFESCASDICRGLRPVPGWAAVMPAEPPEGRSER